MTKLSKIEPDRPASTGSTTAKLSAEEPDRRLLFGARHMGAADLSGPIAAVGNNTGGSGEHAYVFGFAYAAQILLSALTRRRTAPEFIPEDALIHPIAFNTRHFVELFLKDATKQIHGLRSRVVEIGEHHDIERLWPGFEEACRQDRRLRRFPEALREAVWSIAALDPTGQTFRYRRDRENAIHLADVAVISVRQFEASFSAMFALVKDLYDEIENLQWEYILGTYTDKLSRGDLIDIARRLGVAGRIGKTALAEAQSLIRTEYSLSRTQYASARAQIDGSYFLSHLADNEKPLKELTVSSLGVIAFSLFEPDAAELLTDVEVAALWGILCVGDAVGDSEYYDPKVAGFQKHDTSTTTSDVLRTLRNQPPYLRRGLLRLGQAQLVEALDSLVLPAELEALRDANRGGR